MALSAIMSKLISLASGTPDLTPAALETSIRRVVTQQVPYYINANAGVITAGTALNEAPVTAVRQKSRLVAIFFIPAIALVADPTNSLTFIVNKRTKATPAAAVNLLTFPLDTAGTDNMTAWDANDLLNATGATKGADAAFNFEEEDVLTLNITKQGTGLSTSISAFYFHFEPRD